LHGVSSVASLRRERIFVQSILQRKKARSASTEYLCRGNYTSCRMSILCVLTPEIKPVKPGFLPAHKPGFTGLKMGGLPGFSGTRVPGLHSLVAAYSCSICSRCSKALSPIRRRVRGTTRLPHDEARIVDRPGILATDVRMFCLRYIPACVPEAIVM